MDILIQEIWAHKPSVCHSHSTFRPSAASPSLSTATFRVPPTVTRTLKPSVAWSAVLAKTPPRYGHVSASYYRDALTLSM